jgi:hypothetical protein
MVAVVATLTGCAQPPVDPVSPYFERLLQYSQPGDFSRKQVLEKTDDEVQATALQDLLKDGFRVTTYEGPLSVADRSIICENVKHYGSTPVAGTPEFAAYLSWGGLFAFSPSNAFRMEIVRGQDCELLEIVGYRFREGI